MGERIPSSLWRLAVRLVGRHGVSQTAGALRLDYYSLKERAEAAEAAAPPATPDQPAFVELPPSAVLGKQCLFELDRNPGTRLRVHLVGYDAHEIEILARTLGNAD
ncbi:MAG TPA: hypothetical protein VFE78_26970 [Gemmataceae bacterium]|nr:hypothetical protein [Gemmataceae bacterium]